MRRSLAAAFLLIAAVFVFAHTGSRADALCEQEGSAVPDGLSLFPPGARCVGGLPERVGVELDFAALTLAVPAAVLVAFGGAALADARQRRRARGPHRR